MLNDLLYSIEDVWLIWIISSVMLAVLSCRSLRKFRWRSCYHFLQAEAGSSYILPYMLAFPVYLLLVCFVIQSTMIIITKIGVMHAAHMAARSAVVWRSADPFSQAAGLSLARDKATDAAVMAMAPYASGLKGHSQMYLYDLGGAQARAAAASPKAFIYEGLYRNIASHPQSKAKSDYVIRKFIYAAAMTNVSLTEKSNTFNEELTAEVIHTMPIHIPGAGRIMGALHWTGKGYYRVVRAKAMLPLETPDSDSRLLGIGYDPSRL